jgi:hypothetical protein
MIRYTIRADVMPTINKQLTGFEKCKYCVPIFVLNSKLLHRIKAVQAQIRSFSNLNSHQSRHNSIFLLGCTWTGQQRRRALLTQTHVKNFTYCKRCLLRSRQMSKTHSTNCLSSTIYPKYWMPSNRYSLNLMLLRRNIC